VKPQPFSPGVRHILICGVIFLSSGIMRVEKWSFSLWGMAKDCLGNSGSGEAREEFDVLFTGTDADCRRNFLELI